MKKYKVLTERSSGFSGQFDPESLEASLNDHAAEGWQVAGSFVTFSIGKNPMGVVILERDAA